MWWPGTELNRRRQPFQSVAILYIQQLAGRGRCVSPSKYVQVILIMGCIVGCGGYPCSDALRVNPTIDLTDFHDLSC
jgi:hypothetical protein